MYPGSGGMYPRGGMDPGEQTTGTRDEHYALISVLYHALHGAENCDTYAIDAEVAERADLADFFREAQVRQRDLADRAKGLLGIGSPTLGAAGGGTMSGTTEPGTEVPPTTAPPPTETPPDIAPVDVRGRAAPEVGFPPDTPGNVPPETSLRDIPETEGPARVEREVPPETVPGDVPPASADVQREAQIRADQGIGVPTERPVEDVPPRASDLRTEEVLVPPETRRTEPPPLEEEPSEAGRSAGTREYFGDLIRESARRSRGEI